MSDCALVLVDLIVITTRERLVTEEVDILIVDSRETLLGFDVL